MLRGLERERERSSSSRHGERKLSCISRDSIDRTVRDTSYVDSGGTQNHKTVLFMLAIVRSKHHPPLIVIPEKYEYVCGSDTSPLQ